MVKSQISEGLKKALQELGFEEVEPNLEQPQDTSHGDYSSNIAMIAFGSEKRKAKSEKYSSPLDLAKAIVSKWKMENGKWKIIDRIEAVAPGFINFFLSKEYLVSQLNELLSGKKKIAKSGKTVVIEFTDPNPFKEFHIGHLYSNIVGEAISRLFEASGAEVKRVNYQGDVGLHVAKALYGLPFIVIPNSFRDLNSVTNEMLKQVQHDMEKKSLEKRVKILGEAYANGSKEYESDQKAKEEINNLNKKVYEQDPEILEIYQKGRQWSLDYFEEIYKRLGTTFTRYYFESEVGKRGVEIVKQHLTDGIFEESEGAVIFPGKKYGLHTRVFINSLGLPTYEAKELGLAFTKHDDFSYDISLIVTGNEIKEYFKVLLKALSLISPDLSAKTKHIPHGMVRLPAGKMSSRTGTIVTGEWLLDETKKAIVGEYKDMDLDTAELVAVGAVKYALLKSNIGSDITFDFHESINLQGNSGPYLQYTYVRTQSVIKKAEAGDWKLEARDKEKLRKNEEIEVLRLLVKFDEVIENAQKQTAPNLLCNYLFELAQAFNLFYQKHKILPNVIPNSFRDLGHEGSNEMLKQVQHDNMRLALTAGVGKVLKTGLNLLGISAPERM